MNETTRKAMFGSETVLWATPVDLFKRYDDLVGGFDVDVCALPENAKCAQYFTPWVDGLKQEWRGKCWMNPPYGNAEHPCKPTCTKKKCIKRGSHCTQYVAGIRDWVAKAHASALAGATVVCLLPARTDTAWWHKYVWDAETDAPRQGVGTTFLKGRIKFGNAKAGAPFPSVVVAFTPAVAPISFAR